MKTATPECARRLLARAICSRLRSAHFHRVYALNMPVRRDDVGGLHYSRRLEAARLALKDAALLRRMLGRRLP